MVTTETVISGMTLCTQKWAWYTYVLPLKS